jgi:alpha-beta hydrolase superfamily lysophospholipase
MLRRLTRPLALLALALGLGGAFAGCASLDEWQRQAIFNPARDNPRWFSEPIAGTEEYDLTLPNGQRVHAWHIAQAKGAADAPTVLYLHGARWNMNGSVFRIARWHELGFNVLAVDYRGFGRSTDLLPSEQTAADDARLAFEELKRRQPDPARRYLYGHSLGGALAIDLASRELRADPNAVAGVIIESTFTSIPDVVRGMKWAGSPASGSPSRSPSTRSRRSGTFARRCSCCTAPRTAWCPTRWPTRCTRRRAAARRRW